MMVPDNLYAACFGGALLLSLILTPTVRWIAVRFEILDHPISNVKTHRQPVPYLGGLAITLALSAALVGARLMTNFPTGTLHTLRGILFGGLIILALGLVDDIRMLGVRYQWKFVIQILAAVCLMRFDVRIHFIEPAWVADILTVLWVVGIMNAVNIVDIMDGLASGVGVIACAGFLFIALPSEQVYVNFLAAALAGALLGFMPFNLSKRLRLFMGDAGSLVLGFLLAALSLGTSYTRVNNLGVFAPILILGIPIFDTILVTILRLKKGMSPFLGSKDHFALRLEKFGFFRPEILGIVYMTGILLTFIAYEITRVPYRYTVLLYSLTLVAAISIGAWLVRIDIDA
jgi:UDP-GlcNAc:undecaprenyl-phosphate GlcNAc-1-phosphate transferase